MRITILIYGVVSYVIFLVTLLHAIGFVGGLVVTKHVDAGTEGALVTSMVVNAVLLGLFAVQHTIMARPAFKKWWTGVVPPAAERSTFVLVASLLLALMMWQWRPLPDVIWDVAGPVSWILWALFALGWGTVLLSTFLIDHFDLFGMRQVVLHFRGAPLTPPRFVERSLYKVVRHPLMLGFIVAFWATPHMTVGHLFFAAVTTVYILLGIQIEERDLMAAHPEEYADYRRRVRALLPIPR